MKLVSLLLSIAVHIVIAILFYVVITYEHGTIKTSAKIYSVNLVAYQHHKNTTHIKKTFNIKTQKTKHKVKIKPKIKEKVSKIITYNPNTYNPNTKPKISLKYKNSIYKKRIEEKIRHMRNLEMSKKIKTALKNMRENINENSSEELEKQAVHKYVDKYVDKYGNLVRYIIKHNWYMDTNLIKNQHLITILDIRLDYKGNIIYISLVKHSGNSYFDRSTMNAVKRSDPLPKPPVNLLNSSGYIEFIVNFDSEEKGKL